MTTPIHTDIFYHDGRGPELRRAHWNDNGTVLKALDYFNPDDAYDDATLKHVLLIAPQAVMITPEEVMDYMGSANAIQHHGRAAMFDLGRSAWLSTFSPRHLERCRHFQVFFYDELFDIIAEGLECRGGGFAAAAGG